MTRLRTAAWWAVPSLVCLLTHWLSFQAWFRADDFAWLGNLNTVHNARELLDAVFSPRAQGTIRPWSERIFFMAGYGIFGLHSLPFRLVIFGTQFAVLALVAWIGWRITGMRSAGFLAAILWTVNSVSMQPLGWACVYNEVMCAGFLLLAFTFLLRYIDTGQTRYNVWQWVVFILGFGALELNVVYPALAAIYTWACARKYFRGTLPLFAVSAAYTVMHTLAAPPSHTGVYGMHYDASMFATLAKYLAWSFGPVYLELPLHLHRWVAIWGAGALGLAVAIFAARRVREGKLAALFCLAWYLVVIAPVLPLRDHVTEYYPYLPEIGLAWLAGWALACAWRAASWQRPLAIALAGLYVGLGLPRLESSTRWNYAQTMESRNLVEGVAAARQVHPHDAILLYRTNLTQYTNVVRDNAFPVFGLDQVYLAPGSEKAIGDPAGGAPVSDYELAPGIVRRALDRGQLVVYDASGPVLRNITSQYALLPQAKTLPSHVNVADPLTEHLLGPEWYPNEGDHRWMALAASVRIAGPTARGESLYLTASDPEGAATKIAAFVDDAPVGSEAIQPGAIEVRFPLPDSLMGREEVKVRIEVDRTLTSASDPRQLGLAFGIISIR